MASAPGAVSNYLSGLGGDLLATGVGTGVGVATGSPTLGLLAGAGTKAIASMAATGGPVGLAVAGIVIAGTALTETFRTLQRVADELTDELSQYVGVVAVAKAQSQVSRIQQDIQFGSEIGTELAELTAAETELSLAFRRLEVEFLKPLLPIMRDLLIGLSGIVKALSNSTNVAFIESVMAALLVNPAFAIWAPLLRKALEKFVKDQNDKDDPLKHPWDQKIKDFLDPAKVFQQGPGRGLGHQFPNRKPNARGRGRGVF